MPFSGDLHGGISLTDVFQNIAANRVGGTLHVKWRQQERFAQFSEGAVVGFSVGVGKGLPILEFLQERGYVDPHDLENLRKKNRRSRKPQYRLVREGGLITDEDLTEALCEQVQEQIFELVQLKEAEFNFSEGDPPGRVFEKEQKELGLRLEIGPLLMEGARRRDEWERIQRVVSSERDVFVLLEGWNEIELDDLGSAVAELLDGTTDVEAIIQQVGASTFDVMRAISILVHEGVARPCTAEELEELAESAIRAGDCDVALRILDSALRVERGNTELRMQRAEILARIGRGKEAAADYVLLGHEAHQAGECEQAVHFYDRAAEVDPADLPLLERRIELLAEIGDSTLLVPRVLELVDLQQRTGLADRARNLLGRTLQDKKLRDEPELVEKLALVESALGHWSQAADLYVRLADGAAADAEKVEYLERALEQRPDDEALGARIADLQSGCHERRRRQRRRVVTVGVLATVLGSVLLAGLAEITASHRAVDALSASLGDLRDGHAVDSMSQLHDIREDYRWTLVGRRTPKLIEQIVDLQLLAIDRLVASSEYEAAATILHEMIAELDRDDLRATCQALLERVGVESKAHEILQRATNADAKSLEWIASLTDSKYLDFHLAQLARVEDRDARRAILRALEQYDNPRMLGVVARVSLDLHDEVALQSCERILQRAGEHRARGHEGEWAAVYPRLERALRRPETRGQAQFVIGLLRGS